MKRTGRDIWQAVEAETPTTNTVIATILDRAAARGWDVTYGPTDTFVAATGNADRGLIAFDAKTGDAVETVDFVSSRLSIFALDRDGTSGQRTLIEVQFRGWRRWGGGPYGFRHSYFTVIEHGPAARVRRPLLDGWVGWQGRLRLAWHSLGSESHGYSMPRRPREGPWRGDELDEGIVRPAAWASLARVVLAETREARQPRSPLERPRRSRPRRTTAVLSAPTAEEFDALGEALFGRQELARQAARWWREHGTTGATVSAEALAEGLQGEGAVFGDDPVAEMTTALRETPDLFEPAESGGWTLWEDDGMYGPGYVETPQDRLIFIRGAASAGWDIALGPEKDAVTVVRGPNGADVRPEAVDVPSMRLRSMTFTTLRDPLDLKSPGDDVELEVVHRCRAGGTAMYVYDISQWEDLSPGSSAPSVGWVSVIGDEALVAFINDDIGASRVFKTRLLKVPAELHGSRYWLLVARATQHGLFG